MRALLRVGVLADAIDIARLPAFIALYQFVVHRFAILERLEAFAHDLAVMDKDILTCRPEDEPVALLRIKPFYSATCRHRTTLSDARQVK